MLINLKQYENNLSTSYNPSLTQKMTVRIGSGIRFKLMTSHPSFRFEVSNTMATVQKCSFQKRGTPKSNLINGTKPSLHNSQLLVSSGIASLDGLIGGGIPVGSLVVLNEDEYGVYSKFFLKYFLAEGIVSRHAVFVGSQDVNPEEMVKQLPNPVDVEVEDEPENDVSDKKMTIAWRYENLKVISATKGHKHFGHYFDLSKNLDDKFIKNCDLTYWSKTTGTSCESFQDSIYSSLLQSIKEKLEEGQHFAKQTVSERNILRIGLHRLGSLLWQYDCDNDSANSTYLLTFLFSLRALLRNAFATCFITLPFNKHRDELMKKCIHLSDIALQLESFAGTECENVAPYKDYHGFFVIQKLAAINTLVAYNSQTTNLAFKLRRRKLVIEEFHLPPELDDTTEREDDSNVLTCASSGSKKFDF